MKILNKILFYFFATLFLLTAVFIFTGLYIGSYYNSNAKTAGDCAVVFGAAVEPDKSASQSLQDRLNAAYRLYKDSKVKCILVSGAPSPFGVHETEVMKDFLIELGVDKKDIKRDTYGLNTCYSLKNLDKNKSYILVSNDFHLARIDFLARNFGLNYSLQPARQDKGPYIKEGYFLLREIVANIYYRMFFDGSCETGLKWLSDRVYNIVNSL